MYQHEGKIKVLFLEDQENDVVIALREINKAGIEADILRVENEEAFRTAIAQFNPDIVICDFVLPSYDGMSALRLCLSLRPEIPVIMYTGSMTEEIAVDCIKTGADNYILKENPARLGPAIHAALLHKSEYLARIKAQNQLISSEARYRMLAENATDLIMSISKEGELEYISPSVLHLLGYNPQKLIGRSPFEFIHPDDEPSLQYWYQKLITVPCTKKETFRAKLKNDSYRWFEAVFTSIANQEGIIIGVHAIARDISDRMDMERALQDSNDRYCSIVESAPNSIWIIDTQTKFVYVNPQMCTLTGYTKDELLSMMLTDVIIPTERELQVRKDSQHLLGQKGRYERTLLSKDGNKICSLFSVTPFQDQNGSYSSIMGIVNDLTDKQTIQRLQSEIDTLHARKVH